MLDQLAEKLQKVVRYLKGEAKITERNMAEALRQIKLALLEADVNYQVVKDFIEKVREKALNQAVMESLTPAQQTIKIVRDELTALLGGQARSLIFRSLPPTIFILVGLQGSGKTTTCGKLAFYLKKRGKRPLLASFDLKRPAAQEQLKMIASQLNLPFYGIKIDQMKEPEKALKDLLAFTRQNAFDVLIVDTAGRLHIDEELMNELKLIKEILQPDEVIFIGDALTGQDAVRSARAFEEKVGLTAVILTKMDGDARGGAALSIVRVTGKPIVFIGVGEKYDQLEIFHPDRMASRLLGMGDVLSLIEKVERETDLKEAEELARRLQEEEFTLEDFRKQLIQLRKMGSLSQLLAMLPQIGPFKNISKLPLDERQIIHFEAIINSMTIEERSKPWIIDGRRRARIAKGSGRPVHEVNQLLRQFNEMKKMMKSPLFKKMINSEKFRSVHKS
ncbi:MAG: signal recognition particle protein [Candidatus Aminicenantes bacterium]|nr:signal recognition particle protein [Candidatus Aminicenantes bacterium]